MAENTKVSKNNVHLGKDTILRIAMDVKGILKNPVENVYFVRDQSDLRKAYAMVIGTRDTPYDCVPMFYDITFPDDYPHSPPKFKFLTYKAANRACSSVWSNARASFVRLHPNYYVNGKCCLSILNTWRGQSWSGCQTISSVLNVILMTLTEYPLENEPGKSGTSPGGLLYRSIILDAGLSIIGSFLNDELAIRFSQEDAENQQILAEFKAFYKSHLTTVPSDMKGSNDITNGDRLIKSIRDTDSRVNVELRDYEPNVPVFSAEYSFEYSFTYDKSIPKIISELSILDRESGKN
jgi:ubiquitin-protein ligase